jgi:microcystin-dependent protein
MAFLGVAPTGTVLPFAGSAAPDGWAICNSGEYSKTTYAALFAVIGTTYGETNGSGGVGTTHFRVPDMRGVFPRGAGTNGTSNYGGVTGHTPAGGSVGAKGGQKTAKNGLANSASSISALSLGNQNTNHSHADNGHGHGFSGDSVTRGGNGGVGRALAIGDANDYGIYIPTGNIATGYSSLGSNNLNHSHALSSGTAAAQTVSSTDTETTPASLSLNYIIKL